MRKDGSSSKLYHLCVCCPDVWWLCLINLVWRGRQGGGVVKNAAMSCSPFSVLSHGTVILSNWVCGRSHLLLMCSWCYHLHASLTGSGLGLRAGRRRQKRRSKTQHRWSKRPVLPLHTLARASNQPQPKNTDVGSQATASHTSSSHDCLLAARW